MASGALWLESKGDGRAPYRQPQRDKFPALEAIPPCRRAGWQPAVATSIVRVMA